MTKWYVSTGDLKEIVQTEEARVAAVIAIFRVIKRNQEVIVGRLVYVSEAGFGEEEASQDSQIFLIEELTDIILDGMDKKFWDGFMPIWEEPCQI